MDIGRAIGRSDDAAIYQVPDDELATGSTLGSPSLYLTIKATGAIEKVFSVAHGVDVFGALTISYWDTQSGARLHRQAGVFRFHPERQEHDFALDTDVQVHEDIFTLSAEAIGDERPDPPVAYHAVRLRNASDRPRHIVSAAYCQLGGPTPQDASDRRLIVTYQPDAAALLAEDRADPACPARAFGCFPAPASFETTLDEGQAEAEREPGPLSGRTEAGGPNPFGVFQHRHTLGPGEEVAVTYALTFADHGAGGARATYQRCPTAPEALRRTEAWYRDQLASSVVLTPDRQLNHGVLWAKVNMLRVHNRTPLGWTFTNNPTKSSKAVGRDTAWFALGSDYLTPAFARAALLAFTSRQEPSGLIAEDFDYRTGETADNGLNINDNTPLLALALWHHYCATGDVGFLNAVYPAAAKAARHIVSQENDQGLVFCTATGVGAKGIVGWRNVVQGFRLSGATLEVNAECYGALRVVAQMAAVLGEDEDQRRFDVAAATLKEAVNRHLLNPDTGLYDRNIGPDGVRHSEVTSDLVFPLLFGLASSETATRIVQRLTAADFWTEAGIRTVPRSAPTYSADHGYGLLGGVWVGVTAWFVVAAAQYVPALAARVLRRCYQHYSHDPRQNNTVPGQFSEWLHGESLVNQGMMLSPWFPPRYLWAAIEGLAGFTPEAEGPRLTPHLSPEWRWLAVRDLPFRGERLTWLTVRAPDLQTYATFEPLSAGTVRTYPESLVGVHADGDETCALGFRAGDTLLLFVGSCADHGFGTALRLADPPTGRYRRRRLDSVQPCWRDDGVISADDLRAGLPLRLEPGGFCLFELQRE